MSEGSIFAVGLYWRTEAPSFSGPDPRYIVYWLFQRERSNEDWRCTMKRLLVLVSLLCPAVIANSQTVCFEYAGGVISCDRGDGRSSTRVPLSRNQGVIQTEKGIEPYTIFQAPSTRDSFSSRPIEPLEPLRPLDSRSRRDRLDDPFSDPLTRSLLLGE
jgi:hypothetical protein